MEDMYKHRFNCKGDCRYCKVLKEIKVKEIDRNISNFSWDEVSTVL